MISVMVPRGAPSRCVNYIAEDFFFLSYDCAIFLLKNDVRFTFAVWFEFKIKKQKKKTLNKDDHDVM